MVAWVDTTSHPAVEVGIPPQAVQYLLATCARGIPRQVVCVEKRTAITYDHIQRTIKYYH